MEHFDKLSPQSLLDFIRVLHADDKDQRPHRYGFICLRSRMLATPRCALERIVLKKFYDTPVGQEQSWPGWCSTCSQDD